MGMLNKWLDSIASLLILIVVGVAYVLSKKFQTNEEMALNPAFYPRLIITIIVMLTIIMLANGVKKAVKEPHMVNKDKIKGNLNEKQKFIVFSRSAKFCVLLFIYGFSLKYLGFILATIIMLVIGMLMLNYRNYKNIAIITVIVTVIIYVSFTYLLNVRFPTGILF